MSAAAADPSYVELRWAVNPTVDFVVVKLGKAAADKCLMEVPNTLRGGISSVRTDH
jgi:hypothetical protein